MVTFKAPTDAPATLMMTMGGRTTLNQASTTFTALANASPAKNLSGG
jgi:hypothetical protein